VLKWPDILQGILFAYRTTIHTSTKYSPFFILYQREPVLPVDVQYNDSEFTEPLTNYFENDFDETEFSKTVETMIQLRGISIY